MKTQTMSTEPNNTSTHTLRPDFYLVVIRHNLKRDWNIPEHIDKIERSETVYLFDKNVHVHCCEITPSYELWPVETRAVLKPELEDRDDIQDEIDEIIQRASTEDQVEYHHVNPHDRWMAEHTTQVKHIGEFRNPVPYEESTYDEQREATIEYYGCNSAI